MYDEMDLNRRSIQEWLWYLKVEAQLLKILADIPEAFEIYPEKSNCANAPQLPYPPAFAKLYIAFLCVQEMGGKMWVESDGKGTGKTFWFSFPLRQEKLIVTTDKANPA